MSPSQQRIIDALEHKVRIYTDVEVEYPGSYTEDLKSAQEALSIAREMFGDKDPQASDEGDQP